MNYPMKPVHELRSEEMDVSQRYVIYLGYDEPSGYDVWLFGRTLKFATSYVQLEVSLDDDNKSWNDHPQGERRWIKCALDGGWLDDYCILYKCEECGEIFVAEPDIRSELAGLIVTPACPECDSEQVSGQTAPKTKWDMARYLIEEWGPAVAQHRDAIYQVQDMDTHADYAEAGYCLGEGQIGIVTGNWNSVTEWTDGKPVVVDGTPGLLGHLFEALGFELEWSDEWTTCESCYRIFRYKPDSCGWQPSYFDFGCGGLFCLDCVDPESMLEDIEGDPGRALNLAKPIDPEDHGYVLVEAGFEHGLHYGQDADPKVIAESLKKMGVTRFVFMVDGVGQFDVDFSLYVHESEADKISDEAWESAKKNGPSVAAGMERALQNAPVASGAGIHVTCAAPDCAVTVEISPEDFVKGRSLGIAREALRKKLEEEEAEDDDES